MRVDRVVRVRLPSSWQRWGITCFHTRFPTLWQEPTGRKCAPIAHDAPNGTLLHDLRTTMPSTGSAVIATWCHTQHSSPKWLMLCTQWCTAVMSVLMDGTRTAPRGLPSGLPGCSWTASLCNPSAGKSNLATIAENAAGYRGKSGVSVVRTNVGDS